MGATDYTEMPGSPSEQLNAETGEITATRILQCNWLDRYLVRDRLFDYRYRRYSYDTNLWAMDCTTVPFDTKSVPEGGTDRCIWDKAILTVAYKTLSARSADPSGGTNVTGADFITQELDIETQFLSMTSGDLYWNDITTEPEANWSAVDDGQAPQKRVQVKNYKITFHNADEIPEDFELLIGTVNTAAYVVDIYGEVVSSRTGNFLYNGYAARRSITQFGTAGWNIDIMISEMMNGEATDAWNKFWNPNTGAWSYIYDSTGTQVVMYEDADWTDLAMPPQYVAP